MHGSSVHFFFREASLREKLGRLKLLQALDQVLDGLQQQRDALPKELAGLEDTLKSLQLKLDTVTQQYKDLQANKKKRELDLAEENDRVRKYDARLKDLKTNREYQALLREIGFAKKASGELSEELVRLDEELKLKKEDVAAAEAAMDGKKEELTAKRKEIEKALKEVEKSYAGEVKRRDELFAEVPKDLIARYTLIRKRTNLVVVNVKSGACQGCFMSLPPQLYNQVRRNDTLYTCPNCHRIMLYEPPPEAAKA
jgi:predicted  nucleic acid-binding Zn-ribbon protein